MLQSLARALAQRSAGTAAWTALPALAALQSGSLASCSAWRPSSASQQPAAGLHSSSSTSHGHSSDEEGSGETISVTFKCEKDGSETTVRAPLGKSLLEVAHANDIELEGACEGSLACSTCHVIVEDESYYNRLPEPCEDELDMLDLAFGLTDTSRLGCQVIAAKDLDGLTVRLPSATRNFYVSEKGEAAAAADGARLAAAAAAAAALRGGGGGGGGG
ncbi:adrenodoxin mitochondrial [Raphidocelis subcapitata]|uniref:2Fe-2S ferredoxin n=1 Tax=Raphidocelis subcapitata TaxID=307507 RepID=A0A2V0P065_9CHLO|nr:adrenodoxin mitochondrial [Raphidocelis subcapitata]|eukprot:GBF93254.1 adrenodoxin mitochondrial [Raphidocelis subcapitata]